MQPITFGVLTVSDSCYEDASKDVSGQLLKKLISDKSSEVGQTLNGNVVRYTIVPDLKSSIMETLLLWSKNLKINVILTTGGTGFSERDVTPEATKAVIKKECPGIQFAMISSSLKTTPMGMLSRAACGIRKKSLIINFPGSPKAVTECLESIFRVIPHAVSLILNDRIAIKSVHETMQGPTHVCSHTAVKTTNSSVITQRLRESPYPMISMAEALEDINLFATPQGTEMVNIWQAYGRIVAEDIFASCNLPPFPASIKDGYAVVAADGKGKRKVLGASDAGTTPGLIQVQPGTCVRINTGAPVPPGADAVVQIEDTKVTKSGSTALEEIEIEILTDVKKGQDIRAIGSDIQAGSKVLKADTKIGSVEMGILAATGCTHVKVTTLPKVGVLSTGDELQQAGEDPIPGHVYDSNKITLMSMLKENGYDAIDLGIAKDEEKATIEALTDALNKVDVLVTTGSVSMGDKDLLKPILLNVFNATIHFGRVNMKPGKPTTFATCNYNGKRKSLLCLPGNPVSAFVTAYLFGLPLLHGLSGNKTKPIILNAQVTTSYHLDSRPEYARAIIEWRDTDIPKVISTGNQISSRLLSCKTANAFIMLPGRTKDRVEIKQGDIVPVMLLGFNQNVE